MKPSPSKSGIGPAIGAACIVALAGPGTAQDAPIVMSLQPDHLETSVNPNKTKELIVLFDQDMDRSVHSVCGGGPSFPKVVGTSWRGARTFVIEVELEADRIYSMDLACAGSSGFWSATKQRLEPTPWRIATAGPEVSKELCEAVAAKLFRALREDYSYLDRVGIDWNDLEERSMDSLTSAKSMSGLALRISELLVTPQDPHISVRWLDAVIPTFQRSITSNFDPRGLQKVLPNAQRVSNIGIQARTEDNIGYLFVGSFSQKSRVDFDTCIKALRGMLDCKAIVIDVRQNGGGDENLARRLAGFFVEGQKVYAAHRYRDPRAPGGFRAKQERIVRANPAPDVYKGPVAVLMGPANMSSCEAFLLMMKQARNAVLVGSTSYGSSGNPRPHTIGPGLTVSLPSWQALRPNGTTFEGEGIEPTTPVHTTADSFRFTDPVLEEALTRLRGR